MFFIKVSIKASGSFAVAADLCVVKTLKTARETDYANATNANNNLVLESLHINRHTVDNINPITNTYASTSPSTHSINTTTTSDVSTASAVATSAKSSHCHNSNGSGNSPSTMDKKKCIELQPTSSINNNNNLLDTTANSSIDMHLNPNHLQKSHCCMTGPLTAITSTVSSSAVTALPTTTDLAREPWYVHHAHHTSTHPQHQLPEEFVMYAPALPTSSSGSSIGKFGIESSTESYLNSRYNVNVKGVRHERTSSFFDIPAVTHPYCYRFPSSPPAGILKKSDEESSYCNNSAVSSSLQFGQHFHNSKTEHPDSTTSHLANHHPHHNPHHHPHSHHHHHHPHAQSGNLHPHHQHAHLSPHHSSAFKFSHSGVLSSTSPSVYHQYNGAYGLRPSSEIASSLTLAPASTTSDVDIKYENPYNTAMAGTGVDSSTAVSSTETDFKLESLYAGNNSITTSHTVSQRRGSLQLWQFLVALLDEPTTNCIAWTGRGMEFKLIEPEEVARRWGIQKNRPAMNYDKLSRSLRYYYEKGIMQKVNGERYVYRFVCDPEALFNMAYSHLGGNSPAATSATKTDQHHHHHHHHLLTAVGKNNLDTGLILRDSTTTSSLDEDSNRERSSLNHVSVSASKHHEQLFYGF